MKPLITATALSLVLVAGSALAQERQQERGGPAGGAPGAASDKGEAGKTGAEDRGKSQNKPARAEQAGEGKTADGKAGDGKPSDGKAAGGQKSSDKGDAKAASDKPGDKRAGGGDDDNEPRKAGSGSERKDAERKDGDRKDADRKAADTKSDGKSTTSTTATTPSSGGDRNQQQGDRADGASKSAAANITDDQRTRLRSVVRDENIRSGPKVNISVSLGQRVPRNVDLRPLPPRIVEIVPNYRSYRYVVVEDRIVIIDPGTYEVVYIIDEDGSPSRADRGDRRTATIDLTADEKRFLMERIDFDRRRVEARFELSLGKDVPGSLELASFDGEVVNRIPRLREHRYVVVDRDVVIVGPQDREIVLVVR